METKFLTSSGFEPIPSSAKTGASPASVSFTPLLYPVKVKPILPAPVSAKPVPSSAGVKPVSSSAEVKSRSSSVRDKLPPGRESTSARTRPRPIRPSLKSCQKTNGPRSFCKTKESSSGVCSPITELVIKTDRSREAYFPSKILRTETIQKPPPQPALDPVAEALQLITKDLTAQALSPTGDAAGPAQKRPVTIKLNSSACHDTPAFSPRKRPRSPTPPRQPSSKSIFKDDIENFCLQVKRCNKASITDRFGELLQRQTVVQQLQRRLERQTAEMLAGAKLEEEEADRQRRQRFGEGEDPPQPPPPSVPPTTATDTLMVLQETGGCCGPADLCLTPHDMPRALSLIHRLRCEVLELRACSLRVSCEKNEVAMQLNRERSQLRRTFTSAQIDRLTGDKVRNRWDAEDVRRAIAARRVLSRRQYRYVTEVMGVPLPSLNLSKKAITTSKETKRLYEQLVTEKVLAHMTKKRRVMNKPTRRAESAALAAAAASVAKTQLGGLTEMPLDFSDSEDSDQGHE